MWPERYVAGDIHYSFYYPRTTETDLVADVTCDGEGGMSVTFETVCVLDQADEEEGA